MKKGLAGTISVVNQLCESPPKPLRRCPDRLIHPLAHLHQALYAVGGAPMDHRAAADRSHADAGLELGAVGASLAHPWQPYSGAVPAPQVNDGPCPEKAGPPPWRDGCKARSSVRILIKGGGPVCLTEVNPRPAVDAVPPPPPTAAGCVQATWHADASKSSGTTVRTRGTGAVATSGGSGIIGPLRIGPSRKPRLVILEAMVVLRPPEGRRPRSLSPALPRPAGRQRSALRSMAERPGAARPPAGPAPADFRAWFSGPGRPRPQ